MALKKFKTNHRLWLALSSVLFVLLWFVWRIGKSGDEIPAAGLFVVLFNNPASGDVPIIILMLAVIFALSALVVSWVIHCVIVLVMEFLKGKIT